MFFPIVFLSHIKYSLPSMGVIWYSRLSVCLTGIIIRSDYIIYFLN
jgi:hypothetical protein